MNHSKTESAFSITPYVLGWFFWTEAYGYETLWYNIHAGEKMKPNTRYACKISKNATDAHGNELGSDYTWSFTTRSLAEISAKDGYSDANQEAISMHSDAQLYQILNSDRDDENEGTAISWNYYFQYTKDSDKGWLWLKLT